MTTKAEVELLTATWCKRCKEIKPVVQQTCTMVGGVSYREVDYDELADDDPVKIAVKALPTIRVRTGSAGEWRIFLPAEIEAWRSYMLNSVAFASVGATVDTDF
jgi:thiol-disulfide isomerase/thioredoxin